MKTGPALFLMWFMMGLIKPVPVPPPKETMNKMPSQSPLGPNVVKPFMAFQALSNMGLGA